ncbi:hypothetical protein AMECASPLE_002454 [Ameca splendens]|uniref:Uncharacterized protein n=1 Tax=Ameca splendens TaxID=208324 RepID=A0ABV0XYP6_9TELE
MPPYSPSLFPPAYLFANDIKGSRRGCVCVCSYYKRKHRHKPRTVKEVLSKQNFAYRPCFCLCAGVSGYTLLSLSNSFSLWCTLLSDLSAKLPLCFFFVFFLPFLIYTVLWGYCSL